jgi:hypothetical protein
MAERVFCIDFGSAYTKVALRRDPMAQSTLLACAGADVDYWVPTVVAVDRRGENKLEFGERAAAIKPEPGVIDVYKNFKKDLFAQSATQPDKPAVPALDALLQSGEFTDLATKYGVFPQQIAALRALAGNARALVAAGAAESSESVEGRRRELAYRLAYHFFVWLRKEVLAACGRLNVPGLKFEEFPVRIAVPALAPANALAQHPGCLLLRDALRHAKWPLHPDQPFVSEPESNAIGVLTKATNILNLRRDQMLLGQMLRDGPLNGVVAGDPHHTSYRALLVDVGAYTTDLASLSIETGGRSFVFTAEDRFQVSQRSIPIGVNGLDSHVLADLSQEKREWLDNAPRKEFGAFQISAYTEGKGYRVPRLGVIGGESDRAVIETHIREFADRVGQEVTAFCAEAQPGAKQELILTGGGSSIPAVREAVINAAQQSGKREFVKTHAPDLKRGQTASPLIDKLDTEFTRGGSALGGASIYFEKQYG